MKVMYIGDVHYSERTPLKRIDNYGDSLLEKLSYCADLAKKSNCNCVVFTGDIFDKPSISNEALLKFIKVINKDFAGLYLYTVIGNHDVYGYNINRLFTTSMGILLEACPNLKLLTADDSVCMDSTVLSGQSYTNDVDVDGFGYAFKESNTQHAKSIHVVHGMLLDKSVFFLDKQTLIDAVETNADIIVSGHYHDGFGVVQRKDGKIFINVGSICRKELSKNSDRKINVVIIDTAKEGLAAVEVKEIPVKPYAEVFDTSESTLLAVNNAVFETILSSNNVGKKFVNIEDLVTAVAEANNIEQSVLRNAQQAIAVEQENNNK